MPQRLAIFLLALIASGLRGQCDEFFAGKTITLVIGTDSGGGQDAYTRLLSRHLGRHIDGSPQIVVQYMPGGSGRRAANYFFTAAPRDGSVIGTLEQNIPFSQAMGRDNTNFDTRRFFYLGGMSTTVGTILTWNTTGVRTIDDARRRDVLIGASGETGTNSSFPKLVNAIAGTRFKVVSGYKAGADIDLAMERGEVEGRGNFSWTSLKLTKPDWLAEHKVNILAQIGLEKAADLPEPPLVADLVTNDVDRAVALLVSSGESLGRMFLTPPETLEARALQLRDAFAATMRDPEFLADSARLKLDISPTAGARIAEIVSSIVLTPAEIIAATRRILD